MIKILLISMIILSCRVHMFSQKISLEDVQNYVGKPDTIKVCGKVFSGRFLANTKRTPTLLNLGGYFPSQKLTVVIFGEDIEKFPPKPEEYFSNKQVCISGVIIDYNGKPEIVVRNSNQIEVLALETNPRADKKLVAKSNYDTISAAKVFIEKDIGGLRQAKEKPNNKTNIRLTINKANLRSGPSPDFPVITTVPIGSYVNVIYSNNGWSRVEVKVPTQNNSQTLTGYITNTVLK